MKRITLEAPDHLIQIFEKLAESLEAVSVVDNQVVESESAPPSVASYSAEKLANRFEASLREAVAMSKGRLPKRSIQAFLDEL